MTADPRTRRALRALGMSVLLTGMNVAADQDNRWTALVTSAVACVVALLIGVALHRAWTGGRGSS